MAKLFLDPPQWIRTPGTFVGVSFCAAEVDFSSGIVPTVALYSFYFDEYFDEYFG